MKKFLNLIRPKKQWIWAICKWGGVLAIVLIISLSVFPALSIPKVGFKALVVLSGSMEPTIKTGSVVVTRPTREVREGEVVTYRHPLGSPRDLVTHRVAKVETKEGVTEIKTKGDANKVEDSWTIGPEAILGKAMFSVPYLGFVVGFVRKPLGFVIFVILPAFLIIIEEIIKIKRTIEEEYRGKYERLKNRKMRKTQMQSKKSIASSEIITSILVVMMTIFTSGFCSLTETTRAYFSDQAKIEGNTVSAGWWVPPNVRVIFPNGGETLAAGSTQDITWTASSSDPLATVTIDIYHSTDSGVTYPNVIAMGETNDGIYSWTLPGVKSTTMRVKVVATDSHGLVGEDTSDSDFDPAEEEIPMTPAESGDPLVCGGQPEPSPILGFFLRKDKKAVGFKIENVAAYESLKYEIVYDTNNGDRGIVGNIKIDGQNVIERDNLVLGTCSGIEGKVCTYDQGISKVGIKVVLFDSDGKEELLEDEIHL